MPDLNAGSPVLAVDTPASASSVDATDLAITNTAYATGSPVCGTAFMAPTSGRVKITWGGRIESNTASVRALLTVQIRAGNALDAGTIFSPANDSSAVESGNSDRTQCSRHRFLSGLTPGNSYNVVTQHRLSAAGTGNVFDRDVMVEPLS